MRASNHTPRPVAAKSGGTADGFIIVAVLWILGALATLASIYAIYVANTAVGLRAGDDRLRAEALISAALELTAYRLTAVDAQSRPTRGSFAFSLGSAGVGVDYRSEAARIDLNLAPKELLAGLLAGLGARPEDAEYYAERIIRWRAKTDPEGQNNEVAMYRSAGLAYQPREGFFPNVAELWLVLGLPPALVERAMAFVTVFSGRAEINVLDAPPEVIAALPGMTPERLHAVLSQRGEGARNAQLVLSLLGPSQAGATTEGSKAMRVAMQIRLDSGRRVNAEATILLAEDGDEPYRVLSWRDDFDGPT